jgi:hypothetical protein
VARDLIVGGDRATGSSATPLIDCAQQGNLGSQPANATERARIVCEHNRGIIEEIRCGVSDAPEREF